MHITIPMNLSSTYIVKMMFRQCSGSVIRQLKVYCNYFIQILPANCAVTNIFIMQCIWSFQVTSTGSDGVGCLDANSTLSVVVTSSQMEVVVCVGLIEMSVQFSLYSFSCVCLCVIILCNVRMCMLEYDYRGGGGEATGDLEAGHGGEVDGPQCGGEGVSAGILANQLMYACGNIFLMVPVY